MSTGPGWSPGPPADQGPPGGWPATPPPGDWGKPPITETPRRRVWIFLVLFVGLIVTLVAAFALLAPDVFRRVTDAFAPGNVPVNEVQVGQCFDGGPTGVESEIIIAVPVVDCSKPHDAEMYARFVVRTPSVEYPGDAAVSTAAESGCVERFEAYVGISYRTSRYDVSFFYPLPSNWTAGDRDVQCMIVDPLGDKITGSLRDARQ